MNQQSRTGTPASKTLSRGIRILEILSDAREPLSIDETAERLQVHRSNVYRLLRTLEDHGLVSRNARGYFALGPRLAALAAGVADDLQAEALPELTTMANELGVTCFLGILDADECITLADVMPRHAVASIARHPGTRHSVTLGAPGKALLMQLARDDWPADVAPALDAEVDKCRARGFATSNSEVVPNVRSIAVPLELRGYAPLTIGVVYVTSSFGEKEMASRLCAAAAAIAAALGR